MKNVKSMKNGKPGLNLHGLLWVGLPAALSLVVAGCGKSSTASDSAANDPSGVISGVNNGVVGAGQAMGASPAGGDAIAKASGFNPLNLLIANALATGGGIDTVCDAHANPIGLSQSDSDYPAYRIFCVLAKNTGDPDSVQGSYQMVQSIACMLEKAGGLNFDGQAHTITATPDSTCFSDSQLQGMDNPGQMTISVTASEPAAFNPYFDKGVVMQVPNFGTFSLGTKVSGSKMEFIAREDQSSSYPNKTGVYAASFDSSTGELYFEARHDRFSCSTVGSCGWSRHMRIHANLKMNGEEVVGLNRISAVLSEINDNGGGNSSANIETASGDLVNGIVARIWQESSANSADLYDPSQYNEVVNNRCYTHDSATADCGSNTGIAIPASGPMPFTMAPSSGYSSTAEWLANYNGLSFSDVSFADIQ